MIKKYSIYLIIITLLGFFIYKADFDFTVLLKITTFEFLQLSILAISGFIVGTAYYYTGFKIFNINEKFKNYFYYTCASYLLNYLPLKVNLIFLGDFLKKKHGLKISNYTFILIVNYFFVFTSSFLLFAYLAVFSDLSFLKKYLNKNFSELNFGLILIIISIVAIGVFLGLKKIKKIDFIKILSANIKLFKKHFPAFLLLKLYVLIQLIFFSLRLYLCFNFLDFDITFNQSLILGLLSNFAFLFSFTPGGIGIKESLLGSLTLILFNNFEIGVVVSLLDRIINFAWILILGSFSLKVQLKEYIK